MKLRFALSSLIILIVCLCSQLKSQNTPLNRHIKWQAISHIKLSETNSVENLNFDGAIYDNKHKELPLYHEIFPLNSTQGNTFEVINQNFIELTPAELKVIKNIDIIGNQIKVDQKLRVISKEKFVGVVFLPFRKNSQTGKIEKLISFEFKRTNGINNYLTEKSITARSYAKNSVLAKGNWYKMSINSTGIYKLTYDDLLKLGMDVGTINPKNIRIYSNGCKMLPEDNASPVIDDLTENPIYISGENDGRFDKEDFVLFYSESSVKWTYNNTDKQFHHRINDYSDNTYLFVTADLGAGKRIQQQSSTSQSANQTITTFDDYLYHEKDSVNLIKSGREWYGEVFDLVTNYKFNFSLPYLLTTKNVNVRLSIAARSNPSNSSFNVNINNNYFTIDVDPINGNYNNEFANNKTVDYSILSSSSNINVDLTYKKNVSSLISSMGWLNFIEINAQRQLLFTNSQMSFRSSASMGKGNISEFILSNANNTINIWDVTNPLDVKKQETNLSGTDMSFRLLTDTIREFIAFDSQYFPSPKVLGKISNQDIHGQGQFQMIIVTPQSLDSYASDLADWHRQNDNMSVLVLTPDVIYNEFSSGAQDISAIRNCVKMFYDRAVGSSDKPKYLLLFGDGSYDFKGRIAKNTNLIPTYEAINSLEPTSSFVTDDYFGLLDNNEGKDSEGDLDIGIGRFPVFTATEAKAMVDKCKRYGSKVDLLSNSNSEISNKISNFADWKNVICFIGDDEDGDIHQRQANLLADYVDTLTCKLNIDKIIFDSYQQISTPGGQRYPDVTLAINKRVEKGAMIVNYTGHGGEIGWSHERVLEIADVNKWTNYYNMPSFITATCEFCRFDDPARTSAGELVFLNSAGGGISLFTTTRLAFSNSNYNINKSIYKYFIQKNNGEFYSFGDLIRLAKVDNGSNSSIRNFVLIGDPAIKLAFPKLNVTTTSINQRNANAGNDTLKAFGKVTVNGFVSDDNGQKVTNFNGIMYPTVFDKNIMIKTLVNDPSTSPPDSFNLQKNILFKGKVSVVNGDFSFSFIMPKDIAYSYGFGKISYYGKSYNSDANGCYKNIIIGGSEKTISKDNLGPNLELFLNDKKFAMGGTTDENPLLLIYICDSSGINTVGNGIGHDIVAIIDNDSEKPIILNDYYEANMNSYKCGTIKYKFSGLKEGKHTIKIKVWDVYNNSSEANIEFVVAKSSELNIDHVYNYPNPFNNKTSFCFDHNMPNTDLNVKIQIFTITGKLIKTINTNINTIGFRVEKDVIIWNGRDEFENKLANGVYFYKLKIKSSQGSFKEKLEKLFILN